MRLGIHTSIAKSLESSALIAAELGANTFQIFSASPRMWRSALPGKDEVERMLAARDRLGLEPLVVHDSYLINLASANPAVRAQSISAFRLELQRCLAIRADYLVFHPGSYKGQTLEEGLFAVIQAIAEAARGLKSPTLRVLIENTAGAGAALGSRFAEVAVVRQLTQEQIDLEIGVCIDTCHCLAAGYDIASAEGFRKTLLELDAQVGLDHVRVIHSNDSKAPLASHIDRHQHIGEGYIGAEGFRRILTHPKLRKKAFILETPVDREGDGRRNLDMLKTLCRRSSTTIRKSS